MRWILLTLTTSLYAMEIIPTLSIEANATRRSSETSDAISHPLSQRGISI